MRVKLDSNPFSFFDGKLRPNKCKSEGETQQILEHEGLMGRAREEDRSLWLDIRKQPAGLRADPNLRAKAGDSAGERQPWGAGGGGPRASRLCPWSCPGCDVSENICGPLWAFQKENATQIPTTPKVNRHFAPIAFWAVTIPSDDFDDCQSQDLQPHHF